MDKQEQIGIRTLLKKIFKFAKENTGLFVSAVSALSVSVTAIFKMATYIYYRGYFDYLNIPISYIEINYQDMLYLFFLNIAMLFVTFVISNIYTINFISVSQESRRLKRWLKQIGMLLLIVFGVFIYFIVYLLIDFSFHEICEYIKTNYLFLILYVISLSFLMGIIIMIGGSPAYCLYGVHQAVEVEKSENKSETDTVKGKKGELLSRFLKRHRGVVFVILIGIALIMCSSSIYTAGKERVKFAKVISITEISGITYFVATENSEWCILKECKQVGENIRINKEHYMLTSLEDRNVVIKEIENGLKDCLVDAEEYNKLLLEQN